MRFDPEFITRLLVGNLGYVLLVVSMMMTRMLLLRIFAIASGLVGIAYSGLWLHDPVGAFWEAMFALAGIFQIALSTYRNRRTKFGDDEQALQTQLVPGAEPRHLRALLRIGSWRIAEASTALTRQGEVAPHLIFLRSGNAGVLVNGGRVATCEAGSLIGEIGFAGAHPATATVVADQPVRYFALEGNRLRRLMKADPEIADLVSRCKRKHLESKLMRMNEALLQTLVASKHQRAAAEVIVRLQAPRPAAHTHGEALSAAIH